MPELHIELDVSALVDVPDEQIAGVEARIREEAQAFLRTLTGYGMAVTKLRAETWTAYVAPKFTIDPNVVCTRCKYKNHDGCTGVFGNARGIHSRRCECWNRGHREVA